MHLEKGWYDRLASEFTKGYFKSLAQFLEQEEKVFTIYPPENRRFNAYTMTPFDNVKVVILGQDPYHGVNQAHGLAFSVEATETIPPSLKNIFKELADDMHCPLPESGSLEHWAKEGVFLLNTVLSVRASEAGSHQAQGWEIFTDATIRVLSEEKEHLVFILWGKPAQKKIKLIDTSKHLVLQAPHPSPLSSYRGFFGSKPFSKSNTYLKEHQIRAIDWCLNS